MSGHPVMPPAEVAHLEEAYFLAGAIQRDLAALSALAAREEDAAGAVDAAARLAARGRALARAASRLDDELARRAGRRDARPAPMEAGAANALRREARAGAGRELGEWRSSRGRPATGYAP